MTDTYTRLFAIGLAILSLASCATASRAPRVGAATEKVSAAPSEFPPPKAEIPSSAPAKKGPAVVSTVPSRTATKPRTDRTQTLIAGMTLEQKVGQLLMIAVADQRSNHELRALTHAYRTFFERVQPGGVIMFGGNIETVSQTLTLIHGLQAISPVPLLVSTDEEGGAVSRLTSSGKIPATPIPSPWTIGETGNPELAFRAGTVIGTELAALGFNMDLAPLADVLTNPKNTLIGTRSFGTDARRVAAMVARMVEGIQSTGVAAVLKHFPGHGDTASDTHHGTAVDRNNLARLKSVELLPFRSGIAAGADGVLTAHIAFPEITGTNVPASLSPIMVDGLLRRDLGFDGVVMTDAMNMAALLDFTTPEKAAVEAVRAGCDILLLPPDASAVFNALIDAVHSDRISMQRLDESVARILALKEKLGLFSDAAGKKLTVAEAEAHIGTAPHRAVMRQIIEAARANSATR